MKHVKRFLALSLAAALLAGCVSCGNSDEKTSPTGGGSGVDSTGAVSYTHLTLPTNREV